jgi:hypothetical protein
MVPHIFERGQDVRIPGSETMSVSKTFLGIILTLAGPLLGLSINHKDLSSPKYVALRYIL